MGGEILEFVSGARNGADASTATTLDWYARREPQHKKYVLKAAVPLFVQAAAEYHMFTSHPYPPVVYKGSGHAEMVHFAFELTHVSGNFRAYSRLQLGGILDLPLLGVEGEALVVLRDQHPGYDLCKALEPMKYVTGAGGFARHSENEERSLE